MSSEEWWNGFWTRPGGTADPRGNAGPTWEGVCWETHIRFWEEVFARHAPGRQMVECGCGSARVSLHFAQRGYDCTMLDYSPEAIRIAEAAFAQAHQPGRFHVGDINALPFDDRSFDVAFSGGVLEFFDDIRRPIREFARVLKPGGLFAANMVPRKFSIQTVADVQRTIVHSARSLARGQVRAALKPVHFLPEGYGINHVRLADYVAACEEAGLVGVVGLSTTPFPGLALPGFARAAYARRLQALLPWSGRFNHSRRKWTEWWGITFAVYAMKPGGTKS